MTPTRPARQPPTPADIDPAATADTFILAVGDRRDGYVLVDRVDTEVEPVAHLVGSNQRPTGQRGLYTWFRHGAEVVDSSALRIPNVATTA